MYFIFMIWLLIGMFFIVEGINCIKSKKEVAFGFWSTGKKPDIQEQNIKLYNKSLGKLWCVFGAIFILLGIPFLTEEQNSPIFIISMIGVIFEVIMLIVIYVTKIENKYKKR